MKPIFRMLVFFLTITAIGQTTKKDSILITSIEWVNKDLDYFRFEQDTLIYNIANKKHKLYYDFGKNRITLKELYRVGGGEIKEEKLEFRIKKVNKKSLAIFPIDDKLELDQEIHYKLDYAPFFKRKSFTFYNRENQYDYIDYKKITFHGSTCFGTCPSFSLEINRGGDVFYQGRVYTKEFTGNFKGFLEKDERIKLHKIINRSMIAVINENWKQLSRPNDTPRYNYIIELRNGETIEINTNDQHPILDKLSNYLVNISEKLELKKQDERHSFVKPSVNALEIVAASED